jgi:hypothetical protein
VKSLYRLGLGAILLAIPAVAHSQGRITPAGVARAQAVVDSVFLDRKSPRGSIEGGDWAAYLMARLGVTILPDSTGIVVTVDSQLITFSGRIRDLPVEARAMLGSLSALVDPATVLSAEVEQVPADKGLAHFRLRKVSVGAFAVPEVMLRSMMMDIGDKYPALTETGRDLFVQIPTDGRVALRPGAVLLSTSADSGSAPPHDLQRKRSQGA